MRIAIIAAAVFILGLVVGTQMNKNNPTSIAPQAQAPKANQPIVKTAPKQEPSTATAPLKKKAPTENKINTPQAVPSSPSTNEPIVESNLKEDPRDPYMALTLFNKTFSGIREVHNENLSDEQKLQELQNVRADNFFEHLKNVKPMELERFNQLAGRFEGLLYFDQDENGTPKTVLDISNGNPNQFKYQLSVYNDQGETTSNTTSEFSASNLGARSNIRQYDQDGTQTVVTHFGGGERLLHLFINPSNPDQLTGVIYKKVSVDFIESIGTVILNRTR